MPAFRLSSFCIFVLYLICRFHLKRVACLLPVAACRSSVLPVACQRRQFHHLLIPIASPSPIPSASPSLGQSLAQSHVYLICALFPSFIIGSISSTGRGTWNGTRLRFVTLFLRSSSSRFSRRFLFISRVREQGPVLNLIPSNEEAA